MDSNNLHKQIARLIAKRPNKWEEDLKILLQQHPMPLYDFWAAIDFNTLTWEHLLIIHGWTFDKNDREIKEELNTLMRSKVYTNRQEAVEEAIISSVTPKNTDGSPKRRSNYYIAAGIVLSIGVGLFFWQKIKE